MRYLRNIIILSLILTFLTGCTTFNTRIDTNKELNLSKIKRGKVCAKYLFGTLKLPWVGFVGIKLNGEESATQALIQGNITKPFGIDNKVKNYFVYSKKCTIVYGE